MTINWSVKDVFWGFFITWKKKQTKKPQNCTQGIMEFLRCSFSFKSPNIKKGVQLVKGGKVGFVLQPCSEDRWVHSSSDMKWHERKWHHPEALVQYVSFNRILPSLCPVLLHDISSSSCSRNVHKVAPSFYQLVLLLTSWPLKHLNSN